MCICCVSFRSAVSHGKASGAHNGIAFITKQQKPQQCGNKSETVKAKQLHMPTKALHVSFVAFQTFM